MLNAENYVEKQIVLDKSDLFVFHIRKLQIRSIISNSRTAKKYKGRNEE